MSKVYDNFAREFIDEEDMEVIAPPERYTIMEDDSETTKADYVVKNISKQVYNVFPFVDIKCEPNRSWSRNDYDICARWCYKGNSYGFKYTITDDLLDYITNDLDAMVYSLTHQICGKIMESCNNTDEEEVTNGLE